MTSVLMSGAEPDASADAGANATAVARMRPATAARLTALGRTFRRLFSQGLLSLSLLVAAERHALQLLKLADELLVLREHLGRQFDAGLLGRDLGHRRQLFALLIFFRALRDDFGPLLLVVDVDLPSGEAR